VIVELTKAAQSDVERAALEYEHAREGLGMRFEAELDRTLERVEQNALQFPLVWQDVRRALLRVFPFSVFFLIAGDRARVFAVLHQHRHPSTWKRRPRE
jgi:plasmid stabilization system protein ParE